jgi:hypothetical protein
VTLGRAGKSCNLYAKIPSIFYGNYQHTDFNKLTFLFLVSQTLEN